MNPPAREANQSPAPGWQDLAPGVHVTVIKLAPDGAEAARYPGEVIARGVPGSWVVIQATWTHGAISLDGLVFAPGDDLREWFSPVHRFNAFAVRAADGALKGWYANVTHLPTLQGTPDGPHLVWHDLYLDLVGLPDKTFTIRDEDELAASGLEQREPHLYALVREAHDEVIRRFSTGAVPFTDAG
ncbi:MAG: DUF402 domain-containing protein [Chloroflexia bacterium]|nr:DUF402 domain-containing protein [Chloroflexia bacterium]